jgi:hypothetical protein
MRLRAIRSNLHLSVINSQMRAIGSVQSVNPHTPLIRSMGAVVVVEPDCPAVNPPDGRDTLRPSHRYGVHAEELAEEDGTEQDGTALACFSVPPPSFLATQGRIICRRRGTAQRNPLRDGLGCWRGMEPNYTLVCSRCLPVSHTSSRQTPSRSCGQVEAAQTP